MSDETRDRLIQAASVTLLTNGYARTSTRAIARVAGVNPAMVFYHFGGVDPLLLAALDRTGREHRSTHQATVAAATTVEELIGAATEIYRAELACGRLRMLSELTAASIANPRLREGLVSRIQPWVAFTEETLERVVGGSGSVLAQLASPRELACVALTVYLGVNMFSVLDPDRPRADALVLALSTRLAPLLTGTTSAED